MEQYTVKTTCKCYVDVKHDEEEESEWVCSVNTYASAVNTKKKRILSYRGDELSVCEGAVHQVA